MKRRASFLLLFLGLFASSLCFAQTDTAKNPICPLSATISSPITATTRIIAAPTTGSRSVYINGSATPITVGQQIMICAIHINVKQTSSAANFGLAYGTGTNCGTGTTWLTLPYYGTASVVDKMDWDLGSGIILLAPLGKDVCVDLSAAPTGAVATIIYGLKN